MRQIVANSVSCWLLTLVLAAGCATPPDAPPPPAEGAADLERAIAHLDRGEVPEAVEPLRRAARTPSRDAELPAEEVELLLAQAEAAVRPETAEQRIAEMKAEAFEAFVSQGTLTNVPYFHDPRIDAYFRKALLSRRADAREIRERLRG